MASKTFPAFIWNKCANEMKRKQYSKKKWTLWVQLRCKWWNDTANRAKISKASAAYVLCKLHETMEKPRTWICQNAHWSLNSLAMTLALLCPKEQHTHVSVYGKKEAVLMMCTITSFGKAFEQMNPKAQKMRLAAKWQKRMQHFTHQGCAAI